MVSTYPKTWWVDLDHHPVESMECFKGNVAVIHGVVTMKYPGCSQKKLPSNSVIEDKACF